MRTCLHNEEILESNYARLLTSFLPSRNFHHHTKTTMKNFPEHIKPTMPIVGATDKIMQGKHFLERKLCAMHPLIIIFSVLRSCRKTAGEASQSSGEECLCIRHCWKEKAYVVRFSKMRIKAKGKVAPCKYDYVKYFTPMNA